MRKRQGALHEEGLTARAHRDESITSAAALLRAVARLPELQPLTVRFEQQLRADAPIYRPPWYRTQKEHWLGWLANYSGPGAYGRKNGNRTAQFIYNHIACPPMLTWLGEASGVSKQELKLGMNAVLSARGCNSTARCAAFRRIVPWSCVENGLVAR